MCGRALLGSVHRAYYITSLVSHGLTKDVSHGLTKDVKWPYLAVCVVGPCLHRAHYIALPALPPEQGRGAVRGAGPAEALRGHRGDGPIARGRIAPPSHA